LSEKANEEKLESRRRTQNLSAETKKNKCTSDRYFRINSYSLRWKKRENQNLVRPTVLANRDIHNILDLLHLPQRIQEQRVLYGQLGRAEFRGEKKHRFEGVEPQDVYSMV
jgi:hypothetical protein